uniref:C2H2-type domain-containing protein n=1 Tax=Octactis speculum TaxID=3111310 RepID=A0A7S2GX48_9STRA|mmetsp:Transcript_58965/g.80506  ORF Transcript_58965/g.80506 Transcript_58965/m.80506 type:complete len:123 (+) Transcript_58965:56-424(+)|eukprot:CAMPEP_0185775748 /NCGR_PEP_ID=MMETSP1174-20130828/83200_1 /TAXON_ID=35687 /ORGANISM="Dictyocha speculum, Strain CCMP1381" /LENGTH=122 /DNA_ID=CAMNT_0028463423 /DNA_START=37 /DNA_END=405 /DNA_ORIENTATION=+
MVRGHAKADAQERNARKNAAAQKAGSQRGAADKAMRAQCPICKQQMPTLKQLQDHYSSRHPNDQISAEVAASFSAVEPRRKKATNVTTEPAVKPKKTKKKKDVSSLLAEGLSAAPTKKKSSK